MITLESRHLQANSERKMLALVCERYGGPDMLKLAAIAKPVPKPDEILVRVAASSITSGDRRIRSLDMPYGFGILGRLALGWNGPRNTVLGATFAGLVQAVGQRAKGFKAGDAVFGINGFRMGAHAEYLCMPATGAVTYKPAYVSFEQAAALPFGGGTALSLLRRAKLQPGETVLVNGAAGNVGMAAVQLARTMGCMVTGVCSEEHLDRVRSLGATRVMDYRQEDFTGTGHRFDVVFDVACNHTVSRCLDVLNPDGRIIRLQAGLPEMCHAMLRPRRAGRQVLVGTAEERADQLSDLSELVGQGIFRPVIAQVFPFSEAIAAHRFADTSRQCGSVVLKMNIVTPEPPLRAYPPPVAGDSVQADLQILAP